MRFDPDGRLDGGPGDPKNEFDTYVMEPVSVVAGQERMLPENTNSNNTFSISNEQLDQAGQVIQGAGLSATMLENSLKSSADMKPKPSRGISLVDDAAEAAKYSKYARSAARLGGYFTGAELALAGLEYTGPNSDQSWDDKARLGVNVGIAAMGQVRHPAVQVTALGLGIVQINGGFDEFYESVDFAEKSGVIFIPIPSQGILVPINLK